MNDGFLENVWKTASRNRLKFVSITFAVFIALIVLIGFLIPKDEVFDLTDPSTNRIFIIFVDLVIIMVISLLVVIIKSFTKAKNGSNLILPYDGHTREEMAEIINRDFREGNFLINESIYDCTKNEKQYGKRIVVTDSYVLIVNSNVLDSGKVECIPRNKIYWICAQSGIKGRSSYVVRLLIFAENKLYSIDGTEPEYVDSLANKIYEYIPNVFEDYEVFPLSYELEECFEKNRDEFIRFFYQEKNKKLNK